MKKQKPNDNVKTTLLGILTIVAAVVNTAVALINNQDVDFGATITAITAGIGLVKAADSK